MNVKCKNRFEGCEHDSSEGCTYSGKCIDHVHNTEPDEAAESARTSGSPTASRSDSVGTTALQLAPVLRPAVGAGHKVAGMDFIDWLYLSMIKKQIEDMIKNATA